MGTTKVVSARKTSKRWSTTPRNTRQKMNSKGSASKPRTSSNLTLSTSSSLSKTTNSRARFPMRTRTPLLTRPKKFWNGWTTTRPPRKTNSSTRRRNWRVLPTQSWPSCTSLEQQVPVVCQVVCQAVSLEQAPSNLPELVILPDQPSKRSIKYLVDEIHSPSSSL